MTLTDQSPSTSAADPQSFKNSATRRKRKSGGGSTDSVANANIKVQKKMTADGVNSSSVSFSSSFKAGVGNGMETTNAKHIRKAKRLGKRKSNNVKEHMETANDIDESFGDNSVIGMEKKKARSLNKKRSSNVKEDMETASDSDTAETGGDSIVIDNDTEKKAKGSKKKSSNVAKDTDKPKVKKAGILYMQTVPPHFTAKKVREIFSQFDEIGKIYLQVNKHRTKDGKRRKRYEEGWIEFKDKKMAKRVAASLNNTPVGGRRRSVARETLWTLKYLNGFNWVHLTEQLEYERKIEQQRMRSEISQAKKEASFFADQVEKGTHLKKLEEKVLKKGGKWEKYQREVEQRQVIKGKNKKQTDREKGNDRILDMIFAE